MKEELKDADVIEELKVYTLSDFFNYSITMLKHNRIIFGCTVNKKLLKNIHIKIKAVHKL